VAGAFLGCHPIPPHPLPCCMRTFRPAYPSGGAAAQEGTLFGECGGARGGQSSWLIAMMMMSAMMMSAMMMSAMMSDDVAAGKFMRMEASSGSAGLSFGGVGGPDAARRRMRLDAGVYRAVYCLRSFATPQSMPA